MKQMRREEEEALEKRRKEVSLRQEGINKTKLGKGNKERGERREALEKRRKAMSKR